MSTNPFRRSSLGKDHTSASRTAPDPDGTVAIPLSLDTRVPPSSQKHVNFASPPDIISPASYPSSPESTRNSLVLTSSRNGAGPLNDYGQALHSDPFQEEASNEDDDSAIQDALDNARVNSHILDPGVSAKHHTQQDAVRDTLSRFASAPRRQPTGHDISGDPQSTGSQRKSLDVDAFKRLLLTGESGPSAQNTPYGPTSTSDSSSNTDTASLSQRSIPEGLHLPIEDTPRSSYEMDRVEHESSRHVPGPSASTQERQRPPPPKPRHGRPLNEAANAPSQQPPITSAGESEPFRDERARPVSTVFEDRLPRIDTGQDPGDSSTKKRPPPPPLARRKNQNKTPARPGIVRSPSSRYSLDSESDEALNSPAASVRTKMAPPAPPPPPSRRPNGPGVRRPSIDLPSTLEEDDSEEDTASVTSRRTVPGGNNRVLPQASVAATPPPIPPPRKNRGSSRSSTESQRPSLSTLGLTSNSGRSSSEYGRSTSNTGNDSRSVSASSNAADILADLAALKREVDDARRHAGT